MEMSEQPDQPTRINTYIIEITAGGLGELALVLREASQPQISLRSGLQ